MLLAIAWRNLWRNGRRTVIGAAAVFMALVLSLLMLSMKYGSLEQMVSAGVNQVGDLQVHSAGYFENKSIDHAFFDNKNVDVTFKKIPEIKRVVPHLETFSLASYGKQTKGIMVSGIDPKLEDIQSGLSKKIIKGHYLEKGDEVLIGDNMAEFLKINVGDSIVLLGQGYRGITAYGIYKVAGIFHLPSLQMNSSLLYMNMQDAQSFVYPYQKGLLTGFSIYLKKTSQLKAVQKQVGKDLGKDYEIIPWQTILSNLLETVATSKAGTQVFVLILYVVAAFGIFSTILMMTMEKRKQYAVMVSIGMNRGRLVWMSILETFMVSIIGVVTSLAVASPILFYMHYHPIPVTGNLAEMYLQYNIEPVMPFSVSPYLFISQTSIILILSFLSALYPVIYVLKFNVLNAFRH
ncbi:MAG: ABC transporter permease [Bacteroidales bacterium]|nr:ABC transporter permease [Bacteroidales bacterium]